MRTPPSGRRPRTSPVATTRTASRAISRPSSAMSDWRPRLIASDMDGTLLRWDDTVSEATVAELERWRADGVPIVLPTGRPPRWMSQIRDVLRHGTAICCNGAVLLDLESFEVLDEVALQPELLESISSGLRRRHRGTWFAVESGFEFRPEPI